jgi:hypothetical protein
MEVAEKWYAQYHGKNYSEDKATKYLELCKLDPETATPEDVEKIVGNKSWAELSRCHECGGYFEEVVEIGEPPDYESSTAHICKKCLRKALKLFN